MPTQLEVRPAIADKLAALAKARGVSVDDLLQEVLDGLALPQDAVTEPSLEEFERDMDALAEGLEHLPEMSKHKDPKTVMRYDHGRENLDQNAVNFLQYEDEK